MKTPVCSLQCKLIFTKAERGQNATEKNEQNLKDFFRLIAYSIEYRVERRDAVATGKGTPCSLIISSEETNKA